MSLIIHNKYKYFDSTVQGAEDRQQKFHFCRLPFAVNVMLNLSNGGIFVAAGPRPGGTTPFSRKRVWRTINFFSVVLN